MKDSRTCGTRRSFWCWSKCNHSWLSQNKKFLCFQFSLPFFVQAKSTCWGSSFSFVFDEQGSFCSGEQLQVLWHPFFRFWFLILQLPEATLQTEAALSNIRILIWRRKKATHKKIKHLFDFIWKVETTFRCWISLSCAFAFLQGSLFCFFFLNLNK